MIVPKWIRRIVRRRMHPMPETKAWDVKQKLSAAYAFFAWNALLIVLYQIYKGNTHWPVTEGLRSPEEEKVRPSIQFAHMIGIKKAQVYRISGAHVSDAEIIEVKEDSSVAEREKL